MSKNQRKPKIEPEQRAVLLTWLVAEYSGNLIRKWFSERGWTPLADSTLSYYRTEWASEIESARVVRRTAAITSGLALKEERIQRLAEHADELEAIKWVPDDKGRLWNEKAWRETLDDIAKEMGHRRQGIDVAVEKELEQFLDRLRDKLPPDRYAEILTVIASSETVGG